MAKRLATEQLKVSIANVNKITTEVFVLFPQNLEKGRISFQAADRDVLKWRTTKNTGRTTVWNVSTRGDAKARDLFNDKDIRNGLRTNAAVELGTLLTAEGKKGSSLKPSRQALAVFLVRDALFDADPDESSVMDKLEQLFGIAIAELAQFTQDKPLVSSIAGQPEWDPNLLPDVLKPATAGADPVMQHFILNTGSENSRKKYGDVLGEKHGFDTDVHGRKLLVSARRGRFIYYRTKKGTPESLNPGCFIGTGDITDVLDAGYGEDGKQQWTALLANYVPFSDPVPGASFTLPSWNVQHGITGISKKSYDEIVAIGSGRLASAAFTASTLAEVVSAAKLEIDAAVLGAIVAAIDSGKHIILTGPPGTAKTTLAGVTARLAKDAGRCEGYMLTTATSDWTTYETIGGLSPSKTGSGLEFRKGQFLQAIAENEWLVIDELNRSNFDRAFGQLFTILSGQSVVLPYEDPDTGKPIAIVHEDDDSSDYDEADFSVLFVPRTWRILATMNVFDKSLLFEMSFALMRRFAFIEVPSPSDAVFRKLWTADLPEDLAPPVRKAIDAVLSGLLSLREIKDIGPAVFRDMARFAGRFTLGTTGEEELAFQLFYSYLLPQFEGIDRKDGLKLFSIMSGLVGDALRPKLRSTLSDVLGLSKDGAVSTKTLPAEEPDDLA